MGERLLLFVGCLNRPAPYFKAAHGKGIAVFSFDEESGTARLLSEVDDIDNPTFLTVDAARSMLYATSEVFNRKEGIAAAYRIDPTAGQLAYVNMQPTQGSIAAQSSLGRDGRFLLVANYGMGSGGPDRSVVALPIRTDGGLAPAAGSASHAGHGPNPERQERPHAHSIYEVAGGPDCLVADLGLDQIISYRLDADGMLTQTGTTALEPGAGPRHLAISHDGALVLAVNELNSTVQSLRRHADGQLERLAVASTLPAGFAGHSHCSEIQLSPDERFVYVANRGDDSIAILEVDRGTGALTPLGHVPCGGTTPRHMSLTPSGRHLLVANQDSDAVAVFRRDADKGGLEDTGTRIPLGTPMCVRLANFQIVSQPN
ncbi:lactonase family protein [Mangrovicella endophytica]|uniref:lactonase family protein n=1 Tax=Mangrovicella endophytica TaxID=2066697 RepID=UPI000C9DCCFA|nr:lactonase family protein [Mangrovicella endophytica]